MTIPSKYRPYTEATRFKFEKHGDSIEGTVSHVKWGKMESGQERLLLTVLHNHKRKFIICNYDLQDKIMNEDIQPGDSIYAEYTSDKEVPDQDTPMKVFELGVCKKGEIPPNQKVTI